LFQELWDDVQQIVGRFLDIHVRLGSALPEFIRNGAGILARVEYEGIVDAKGQQTITVIDVAEISGKLVGF
jgi:hypothetical protein